jgi:hypothetical protein
LVFEFILLNQLQKSIENGREKALSVETSDKSVTEPLFHQRASVAPRGFTFTYCPTESTVDTDSKYKLWTDLKMSQFTLRFKPSLFHA